MEEKKIKQQHRKASLVSKEKKIKKIEKKSQEKYKNCRAKKKSEFMLRYQCIYRKVSLQLLMKILLYITHTYTPIH